jgi:hypothetical protein
VTQTAEIQGATFLASTAEGYLGDEKMKLGGVDLRAPAGIGLQVVGLYRAIKGKKGASHYLSVGNGVTGSWVSSLGRAAREVQDGGRQPRAAAGPAAAAAPGAGPAQRAGRAEPGPSAGGPAARLPARRARGAGADARGLPDPGGRSPRPPARPGPPARPRGSAPPTRTPGPAAGRPLRARRALR